MFLHIPKTGGGTFGPWLELHCRPGCFFRVGNALSRPDQFEARLPVLARTTGVEVVAGHFPFGQHERLPRPARYLTLLRNPVERTLSHYHHLMKIVPAGTTKAGLNPHWLPAPPAGLSLSDCLVEGGYIPPNLQTRMLCGLRSLDEQLPRGALERAKENLSNFAFVGTIERLEEFLALMNVRLGWATLVYTRAGTNPLRPPRADVPSEQVELLEEQNALDSELYRHATGLLDSAVERAGPDLEVELDVLRRAQRAAAGESDDSWEGAPAPCTAEVSSRVRLAATETELRRTALELESARLRVDQLTDAVEQQATRLERLEARADDYKAKLHAARSARGSLRPRASVILEQLRRSVPGPRAGQRKAGRGS